jgi:hypothetical protein
MPGSGVTSITLVLTSTDIRAVLPAAGERPEETSPSRISAKMAVFARSEEGRHDRRSVDCRGSCAT